MVGNGNPSRSEHKEVLSQGLPIMAKELWITEKSGPIRSVVNLTTLYNDYEFIKRELRDII